MIGMLLCDAGGAPGRLQYLNAPNRGAAGRACAGARPNCNTNNCCDAGTSPCLSADCHLPLWPQYLQHIALHTNNQEI